MDLLLLVLELSSVLEVLWALQGCSTLALILAGSKLGFGNLVLEGGVDVGLCLLGPAVPGESQADMLPLIPAVFVVLSFLIPGLGPTLETTGVLAPGGWRV